MNDIFHNSNKKGIFYSILLLSMVFLIGIVGFSSIERWSITDSFYMTVITISTVGYGTPENLSNSGKIFASIIILISISIGVYAISNITAFLVEGRLNEIFRRRKLLNSISKMNDHYIVVGAGDLGYSVAKEIVRRKGVVVLIESNLERLEEIRKMESNGIIFLEGNAVEEQTLVMGGIERSKGLISCLGEDTENLFVVLTAHSMNPDLHIVSKANKKENINKLKYAGASSILPIQEIGAMRMTAMLLTPTITGFLDTLTRTGDIEFRFEQIEVPSNFKDCTLGQMELPKKVGLIVIGVIKDGQNIFNPGASTLVSAGNSLLVLGKSEKIQKLKTLFESIHG